jgi:hypothetical protein
LHVRLPPRVTSFTPIPLDGPVREIAAGLTFSYFILESGQVAVHGSQCPDVPPAAFVAPRGLTASGASWAFVKRQHCVIVFIGRVRRRLHVRDENVIATTLTDSFVVALTETGAVYVALLEQKAAFSRVTVGFPALSLFGSSASFFLANYTNQIFEHTGAISPFSIAFDSKKYIKFLKLIVLPAIHSIESPISIGSLACISFLELIRLHVFLLPENLASNFNGHFIRRSCLAIIRVESKRGSHRIESSEICLGGNACETDSIIAPHTDSS